MYHCIWPFAYKRKLIVQWYSIFISIYSIYPSLSLFFLYLAIFVCMLRDYVSTSNCHFHISFPLVLVMIWNPNEKAFHLFLWEPLHLCWCWQDTVKDWILQQHPQYGQSTLWHSAFSTVNSFHLYLFVLSSNYCVHNVRLFLSTLCHTDCSFASLLWVCFLFCFYLTTPGL